ncbi:adenylosuccinate synthetase [Kosmotoga arenicorallina S304]|uniref:Adenylosuccinate synthetase n=1 Tax=Kosmotoga arenicorallina S304 TaxID=1453497 RepID=A0A176JZE0_9BACT|nr:adenylosuccinate synthase [Kosmotoga arenicorallina]OAA29437.1 adenylosuccinate synthetase [Kosmotoga arenicorallina S304]
MKRIAVIGAQWGDEGKGKIVNYFARNYRWVIRFSGGANAGHTIYIKGKKYVNHLLPSIDPYSDSRGFLSSGMVIDLEEMAKEIEKMEVDFPGIGERFYVDPEAVMTLPWHKEQDMLLEGMREKPIGTTGKGIGPAYTDKVSREGLKIYMLQDESTLLERLKELYALKRALFGDKFSMDYKEIFEYLIKLRDRLLRLGVNIAGSIELMEDFRESTLLFEGAQGVMLDLDFGTYPFVTSSTCTAHGVISSGFSTAELDGVFGVIKAYTTRVGSGVFPTEEHAHIADIIRERGSEFGATTGRPRRVGWLDLPAIRYAKVRSAFTHLIITKGDVLSGLDEIKVCVAYEIDGKEKRTPFTSQELFKAKPIYRTMKGWNSVKDKNFDDYIKFIEDEVELPVSYVSYGPGTDEINKK